MVKNISTILVFSLMFVLISPSHAFHSNGNRMDPNDDENTNQREYTRENASKSLDQGGYYGGHDTVTAEGMLLKKEVHQTDSDGGLKFSTFAEGALRYIRTGAHDEDSTKTLGYMGTEAPIGTNGDGNFFQHYYNPETGKGWLGNDSALRRAQNYNSEIQKKVGCSPGGFANLSKPEREKIYDWFGRTLHLIQDMAHPSHANNSAHIAPSFEDYVNAHWSEIINSSDIQNKISADEYSNGKYGYYSTGSLNEIMGDLSNLSKKYPTDNVLSLLDEMGQKELFTELLMQNVNDLIPEAIKYSAGYIDAMYEYLNNPQHYNPDCNRPPDIIGPAGDHPDDRFDVSDEFYWEKEFKLTESDLTNLLLRSGMRKGKIGIWFKKQFMETFMEGRSRYKDANQGERDALLAKFEAAKERLEKRRNELEGDWKGAPDIALFTNGLYKPSISLMLKIGEAVSFQDIEFNPDIVKDHPVMLVPSGGFYGLSNSVSVKALLDEYVKNGGVLVSLTQQHGSDWGLLPTPEDAETGLKIPITGYGYQEDQSCQFKSVYIETFHPVLSGFSSSTADIGVDGYFTSYPNNATILLRRTANGQPAMILYPYGKGYVIATTLYTDFALSHSQANTAEINLIQNIISWAKKPDTIPEVKPNESVLVPVAVTNYGDTDASAVKFTVLDPLKKLVRESIQATSVPAGHTVSIPLPYSLDQKVILGIYHIDYTLLDGQGNMVQPQAETDSGRFVVNTPPRKYSSDKPIWFFVSTSSQEVLFGSPFDYTFHVLNNTDQVRNLTIKTYLGHTGRAHEWTIVAAPNGESTISGTDPFIDSFYFSETMRASLFDESMKQIGYYELSFRGVIPSATSTVRVEKATYGKGQTVSLNTSLTNNKPISWAPEVSLFLTDRRGRKIFEEKKTISLSAYGNSSFGTEFLLPTDLLPGTYTVSAYVFYEGRAVSSAYSKFDIAQSRIEVTPGIPESLADGDNTFSFTVTNKGKIDVIAGILNVSVLDPDGIAVAILSQPFSVTAGQLITLNLAATVPPLKYGTYTLSYSQSDETKEGQAATISFSNKAVMDIAFDKSWYRARETANLNVELQNTGKFILENALVRVVVPDTGFERTETFSLATNQKLQFSFSLPIIETISAGQHDVEVSLALTSGAALQNNANFAVPRSELSLGYSGTTGLNVGDTISIWIENKGGVDTNYITEKLSISDGKGVIIFQTEAEGTLLAGEKKGLREIQVPYQSSNGAAILNIVVKDGSSGRRTIFSETLDIQGVSASVQARTDKEGYFKGEAISAVANILNGPYDIQGGKLRLMVTQRGASVAGEFSHFLPQRGGWPFGSSFEVAVGGDGIVYVADSSKDVIKKFDRDGRFINKWGGTGEENGRFLGPAAIAIAQDGSIYVVDSGNARIQKFDYQGNFTTRWGASGSEAGEFFLPDAISVGPDGSVYVADWGNSRIQKFGANGNFISQWGGYGIGNGEFQDPTGIAVAPDGSIYVADTWNHRIQKFDSSGTFLVKWGREGSGDGQFHIPNSLTFDGKGFLYVVDSGNSRIQKFDSEGNFISKWGSRGSGDGQFDYPQNIAVAPDGTLYVADAGNFRIQKFDSQGNFIAAWGSSGNADGEFRFPENIAVGPDGAIYVTDIEKHQIQKFDREGSFVTKWGSSGNEDGQFYHFSGIAVGGDGSVYVADSVNNSIQKFAENGEFLARWGTGGEIIEPTGVAAGPDGSVYVVDPTVVKDYRIQKFDGSGNLLTTWGKAGNGDGEFAFPTGIAVGLGGSVYVADAGNCRIQKFDPNGNFLTSWGSVGEEDGQFQFILGIAVGPDNLVYVSDGDRHRIQMFDSDGNFLAKWGKYGSGEGEFDIPSGIATSPDGLIYVADTRNSRIQRYTSRAIFQTDLPINQSGNTSQDYATSIGALDITGKLYLEATLTNGLGQILAQGDSSFYLYEGDTLLSFRTDKKYYRPGETITITGQVENRAPLEVVNLVFSLSTKQGGQSTVLFDTGAFSISGGGEHTFEITTTADVAGPVILTGKVTQNGSEMAEIIDQYEVALPALSASVSAPDTVAGEPFSIYVQIKNEGKVNGTILLQPSFEGQTQTIILSAGETRTLRYEQQISQDTIFAFSLTGDLEQTLTKKVCYGVSVSVAVNSSSAYLEGSLGVPVILTNTGESSGSVALTFQLSSPGLPSLIQENIKSYYLPAGGHIADILYFNLTEGEYELTVSSQVPPVHVQSGFSVKKDIRVDINILAGTPVGGMIPVSADLFNSGFNDVNGTLNIQMMNGDNVVWNGSEPLAQLARQTSQIVTFNIDPSAIPPGDYNLRIEFLNHVGKGLAWSSSPITVRGPAFQITQLPPEQTVNPGEEASFSFKVKNTGNQEGNLEFHFKSYDLIDITRQDLLKAGEEKALDFGFSVPTDIEEKDYFADYQLKGGGKSQVKYHLAGINIGVTSSLDKPYYNEGESARLTLSVSSPGSVSQSLFARVNYAGYESSQVFQLNGNQLISFEIPLPKITGEKLFFGIYQESGRSIHLNSLYVYKAGEVITLTTDKQLYQPGQTVLLTVIGQQSINGNLTLSAPNYEESMAFSGEVQKSFVLPAPMNAGTYFITYQLSGPRNVSGSQPFDVQGIQIKVKEAFLDKAKYAPSDVLKLNLKIETSQNIAATLKTWIVDPEKKYHLAGMQEMALTNAQPFLAEQALSLSTMKLGIHQIVYAVYNGDLLLCSGSYAFDVGDAVLLGLATERADYPQGNEPVIIEAKMFGTTPGEVEFSLNGQVINNMVVSPSGFFSATCTPSAVTPGVHTLKASLTSGGLTSSKQVTFAYGTNLPDLSVRINGAPDIKDGWMTFTLTVTNQGRSPSLPTTLGIYDGDQLIGFFDIKSLQPREFQIVTYRMNALGRAGTNAIMARLDPQNGFSEFSKANNESSVSFKVPDANLGVSLDKAVYAPGETLVITSSIYNLAKDPLPNLTLVTEIRDTQGGQVFKREQVLPTLEGEGSVLFQTFWLTAPDLKEGLYRITQNLQEKNIQAAANAEIKDFSKGVEGTITVQPNPVPRGGEACISYTVTNKGSDLYGVNLKVLVTADDGQVKNTFEKAIDLPENVTVPESFHMSTAGLAPGVYHAVLQVSSAVILTPKSLGSAIFEVNAVIPKMNWAKSYRGDYNGLAYSIQPALDGGYIASGATGGSSPFTRDAWVWKLDEKGDIQWQNVYGSGLGDAAYSVQPTSDGGYIIAGESHGYLGREECWVWKLDGSGEIEWQRIYGHGRARSIQQTSEGGYIVAGEKEEHAWLVRLDRNGEIVWQKKFGPHKCGANSVQQTADTGYVVAGGTGSEKGQGAWVAKLDSQGEIQWQKIYGNRQGGVAYSIQETGEGGYIIAGTIHSLEKKDQDAWVWKIDAHGDIEWQKAYGGEDGDGAYAVRQTFDGGYIVAGDTSSFGEGDYDAWVLKLDAYGDIEWQKGYGGLQGDAALAIQPTGDGGYILAGGTNSSERRYYDVWLWKVDERGEIPNCQRGWSKQTTATTRDLTENGIETGKKGKDTYAIPREAHGRAKPMQARAQDFCTGIPDISFDPSFRFLTFFGIKARHSSTRTITVFNKGTAELEITSIEIDGASFGQKNNCAILSPAHSCAITITFKPTARGPNNGSLEIYSNDPDESVARFELLGTAR